MSSLAIRSEQARLKETTWELLPEEIRDAIGPIDLQKAKFISTKYKTTRRFFWCLKPHEFKTMAIGTIDKDPFFAFHFALNKKSHTLTIHKKDIPADGGDLAGMINQWVVTCLPWEKSYEISSNLITLQEPLRKMKINHDVLYSLKKICQSWNPHCYLVDFLGKKLLKVSSSAPGGPPI